MGVRLMVDNVHWWGGNCGRLEAALCGQSGVVVEVVAVVVVAVVVVVVVGAPKVGLALRTGRMSDTLECRARGQCSDLIIIICWWRHSNGGAKHAAC